MLVFIPGIVVPTLLLTDLSLINVWNASFSRRSVVRYTCSLAEDSYDNEYTLKGMPGLLAL